MLISPAGARKQKIRFAFFSVLPHFVTVSALLLVFAFYLKAHFDSQFLMSPAIELSFVFISVPVIILALRT